MKTIFQSLRIFVMLTIIAGILYPLLVSGLAQMFFPHQANGSLLKVKEQIIGSELLAQKFQDPKYFWPRPSAADYATVASGASNQGPTNATLKSTVEKRVDDFKKSNGLNLSTKLPADMVFASGSGLDPHISPEAAQLQISRIAQSRNFDQNKLSKLKELVTKYDEAPQYGVFGERRVNVLLLNLALDSL